MASLSSRRIWQVTRWQNYRSTQKQYCASDRFAADTTVPPGGNYFRVLAPAESHRVPPPFVALPVLMYQGSISIPWPVRCCRHSDAGKTVPIDSAVASIPGNYSSPGSLNRDSCC